MEPILEQLQYPVDKWTWPDTVSNSEIAQAIKAIRSFPHQMREAVKG